MKELTYRNFISVLNEEIPEFKGFDHLKEHPMIYFNCFADFLDENYSNELLLKKIAVFINQMSKSQDEELLGIVYEFFLNIYSSAKENDLPINNFIQLLSDKSKFTYEESVNTWLKGDE